MIGCLRAGINPAPTGRVNESPVRAGFTPARVDCDSLRIAKFGYDELCRSSLLIPDLRALTAIIWTYRTIKGLIWS
jgi:hypothetical protein